ncbi:MAG: LysR family transcriptional regulator [Dermatophilaceae bacterium]
MNLIRLRYFCALVEEQSFTRAARRLHIAQQSLSQAIAKLEQELRVTLVVRGGARGGVETTDAGRMLYVNGIDLLQQAELLLEHVRDVAEQRPGRLSVGVLGSGAAELTPVILGAFRVAWPRVALTVRSLDFGGFAPALVEGDVDVALITTPLVDDGFIATPLFQEPRAVTIASSHPLAEAAALPMAAVLDEPFFDISEAPRRWADYWTARDERGGLPPRPVASSYGSKLEMLMAAAAGEGVITAPLSTARFFPYPGLRLVPLTDTSPATIAAVARRGATNPLVESFRDIAARCSQGVPGLVPHATLPTRPG